LPNRKEHGPDTIAFLIRGGMIVTVADATGSRRYRINDGRIAGIGAISRSLRREAD